MLGVDPLAYLELVAGPQEEEPPPPPPVKALRAQLGGGAWVARRLREDSELIALLD